MILKERVSKLISIICAEILISEIEDGLNSLNSNSRISKTKMQQILIRVGDVMRYVERKYEEQLDHTQLQLYRNLNSRQSFGRTHHRNGQILQYLPNFLINLNSLQIHGFLTEK